MTKPINSTSQLTRRTLSGTVVSAKMQKTVVVSVDRYTKHPKYGKFLLRSKKYKAHEPTGEVKEGDKVTIEECRPMSKDVSFKVVSVAK
ncbi:MAG: 30S ribosomal protein S17 [Candidatus Vogelbacteria bacterium CG10_big_fil_rev_8_21_14_0_10_50_13]|jgi:small subunit ribosomal protein S17|uniref:Small ribosomal subunit protein uS17 n=1 Tax=Candidatus Vogelbacteria bacterium CG10_big_fil_rev_8_21_14_0_10_50_13 TaxID=1975044 RepID=A0A2H0RG98_9BACT|nr:MAG: 30S ribosomal protein S17 [Candidatus Vogelbacteria bacterium CG10_big_fil_rev_8_21_14_0_10_50_13]